LVQNSTFVDVENAGRAARSGACTEQELQPTENDRNALRQWIHLAT
jgi:hypothetical protein